MEQEQNSEKPLVIVSVTMSIGDGNPFARMVFAQQVEQHIKDMNASGGQASQQVLHLEITPKLSSLVGRLGHKTMNAAAFLTQIYTEKSDAVRTGLVMRAIGTLAGWELQRELDRFFAQHQLDSQNTTVALVFTQEHPLMGLSDSFKKRYPLARAVIYAPDVIPKQSAQTVAKSETEESDEEAEQERMPSLRTLIAVWNDAAAVELNKHQIPHQKVVSLYKQYLKEKWLNGERGERLATQARRGFVFKSSGSATSLLAAQQMIKALGNDDGSSYHFPQRLIQNGKELRYRGAERKPGAAFRFIAFIKSVLSTRLLICPPNENVGLVEALNQLGIPVRMVALPAHGAHELKNLNYGLEKGLILGTLGEDVKADKVKSLAFSPAWEHHAIGSEGSSKEMEPTLVWLILNAIFSQGN